MTRSVLPDTPSLLDVAGVMFVCLDARGRVTLANRKACAVLGVAPAEILGKDWFDHFLPVSIRDEVKEVYRRLMAGEVSPVEFFENPVLTRSGEERVISWHNTLLLDSAGAIAGTLSSGEDVTDRRRAEAALLESEARFRGFFDNAPIGKSMTAPDGRLLRVNPAFCRMLGYTPEEMARRTFAEITHPDDLAESRECVRSLLAGEKDAWVMDKRYVARDGRAVWATVTTRLHRGADGSPIFFLTHILDITERRRAETEAAAWRQRFELATAASGQVAYQCDAAAGTILWSGAVEQVFGFRPEEMQGGYAQWESLIHPEDRAGALRILSEAEASRVPYDAEYRFRHKAGHYLRIRDRGFFAPDTGSPTAIVGMMMDVTARHEAEARARFLANLVEDSDQPIGIGYPDGRLGFCNRAFCDLTGYREDELRSLSWSRVLTPPEWLELERKALEELARTGQPVRYRKEYVRKDGRRVPVELFVHAVRDSAGRVEQYYAFVTDITERQRAETALRESEEALRRSEAGLARAQLMASLGSWEWDIRGNALRWSDEVYRIFGVGRDFPLTFDAIVERIHPEDRARNRAFVDRLLAGMEPSEIELRLVRPDGGVRHVLQRVEARRDATGAVVAAFGTMQDMTERKAAEERIRHLNSVLRAIRDVNQLIVREKDPGRLFAEVCRLLVETRGYRSAWIIRLDGQRKMTDFASAGLGPSAVPLRDRLERGEPPECVARVLGTRAMAAIADPTAACGDCPVPPECRGTSVLAAPLLHAGRIHGLFVAALPAEFVADPEEQSLFQEMAGDVAFAMHGIETEMAQQQTARLLIQTQKLEAVGRLAGGVAHEFNNLLLVILGRAELLARGCPAGDPRRREIDQIIQAGERAAGITRQLLAFSRRQEERPRVIDLGAVVRDEGNLLRPLVGEDIDVVVSTDPATGHVRADPGHVAQILLNLAVNARDAMPRGGRLQIATSRLAVAAGDARALDGLAPGPYAELAVADTGCGMDEATRSRLFEPFFTTKAPGQGTGLGLSIVYGIVTKAGGRIEVESAPGQGSLFRILLPRLEPSPAACTAAPSSSPAPRGRRETILVVEDEADLRGLLVTWLRDGGYEVLEAASGEEALRLGGERLASVRLLLTDVRLTGMSGHDLASRLTGSHAALRVAYMSGYEGNSGSAVTESSAPPGPHLQKPFTGDDLLRAVRETLDRATP